MIKAEKKEIDGLIFTVQQLPGMRATKLFYKLVGILGPSLLQFASTGDLASLKGMDVSSLADAVGRIYEKFSDAELEQLYRQLFETAQVEMDGVQKPLMTVFDLVFAGKVKTAMKLLGFGLQVNFSDFQIGAPALGAMSEKP